MKSYDVIINHKGYLSLDVIDDILHHLKTYLHNRQIDKKIRKRVYSLAVECVDNIYKHADCNEKEHVFMNNYPPRFIVERISENYLIHTGNLIVNKNIDIMVDKLNLLNKLNQEEISILYKESLSKAEISEKGGAGLGLIVMAKTTAQKIKYDFEKINDKFSYFAMQLNIKK